MKFGLWPSGAFCSAPRPACRQPNRLAVRLGRFGFAFLALGGLFALSACAPALDWRDVRPAGAGVQLQFPCKPNGQSRAIMLNGQRVKLALYACAAGGTTWGLALADVTQPAQVGPALAELVASAANNLGAAAGKSLPWRVAGETPNDAAGVQRLEGKLPDGKKVQMQVLVFTRGTLVYQASVLGERVADDAVQTFFESVRLGP